MKAAVVLSFAAAVMAGLLERRECAGDNCKRQVTGDRHGPKSSRQGDCSSFMAHTVVPDATTTTVTVTVDEDDEPTQSKRDGGLEYRAMTQAPTAIPAYASSCDNVSEYSAACSCWGITAVTTTAPTPTVTKTITTTADYCEDL